MFKTYDETNTKLCNAKVIHHLPTLMVCNPIDNFCINNDGPESDEVWNESPNAMTFIKNIEAVLLLIWNFIF